MTSFSILTNLKRQHEDLVELSRELLSELETDRPAGYKSILRTLSLFEGKLKIHLSMEDKHLYPLLMEHRSDDVRSVAREHIREMSGIYDTFHSFVLRWKSDAPPDDFPGTFAGEMKALVNVIYARITKEEDVLFPLLEELGPDEPGSG